MWLDCSQSAFVRQLNCKLHSIRKRLVCIKTLNIWHLSRKYFEKVDSNSFEHPILEIFNLSCVLSHFILFNAKLIFIECYTKLHIEWLIHFNCLSVNCGLNWSFVAKIKASHMLLLFDQTNLFVDDDSQRTNIRGSREIT